MFIFLLQNYLVFQNKRLHFWVMLLLYVKTLPFWVGCSKFRYKSDIKSARIQLVKLLIFNTLYCEIVL